MKLRMLSLISIVFLHNNVLPQTIPRGLDSPFIVECSIDTLSSLNEIALNVENQSEDAVFILLSHWEINGLLNESEVFIGFPRDTYIFNRLHFFPKEMDKDKKIKYVGEQGDFPDFKNFPRVLALRPNEKQKIIIKLGKSITDSLELNGYRFNCQIAFSYEGDWNDLKYNIGEDIEHATKLVRKEPIIINVLEYRKPFVDRPRDLTVYSAEYSSLIRAAFGNFVVGLCNKEKDW